MTANHRAIAWTAVAGLAALTLVFNYLAGVMVEAFDQSNAIHETIRREALEARRSEGFQSFALTVDMADRVALQVLALKRMHPDDRYVVCQRLASKLLEINRECGGPPIAEPNRQAADVLRRLTTPAAPHRSAQPAPAQPAFPPYGDVDTGPGRHQSRPHPSSPHPTRPEQQGP